MSNEANANILFLLHRADIASASGLLAPILEKLTQSVDTGEIPVLFIENAGGSAAYTRNVFNYTRDPVGILGVDGNPFVRGYVSIASQIYERAQSNGIQSHVLMEQGGAVHQANLISAISEVHRRHTDLTSAQKAAIVKNFIRGPLADADQRNAKILRLFSQTLKHELKGKPAQITGFLGTNHLPIIEPRSDNENPIRISPKFATTDGLGTVDPIQVIARTILKIDPQLEDDALLARALDAMGLCDDVTDQLLNRPNLPKQDIVPTAHRIFVDDQRNSEWTDPLQGTIYIRRVPSSW